MNDDELAQLARKNLRWGIVLFLLALLIFGVAIAIAEIYVALGD